MFLLLLACAESAKPTPQPEADAVEPLAPPQAGEGFQIDMFTTAPAYSEVWACEVYKLPTSEVANVNRVEYQQNPGTHHLTLSTTTSFGTDLVPGTYECDSLYQASLMKNQIMFFGAQGDAEGVMQLPEGVAAQLPGDLTVVHEIHYVNTSAEDVELYSRINGWTIPSEEVVDGIWGGSVRDEHINVPPSSTHTEWSRCVMNEDVEVLFLASHTHALGVAFTIAPFDGIETGPVFYENDDWHNPMITQYEAPLVVPAGQGFEWACTWTNPADQLVEYGLTAADEMCNMTVVFTPFSVTAACEVVETSDGVLWQP